MLDIHWSPPYVVKEGYTSKWRREWTIPADMQHGFFLFWKDNKFKMMADGFSVAQSKISKKWFLYEDHPLLFPAKKFSLPEYKIKDPSGLRTWQVDAAGKLCAALNHWGAAIDGSDTGCHAKGQPILMADGTIKKVEDVLVGDKVMGWKGSQTVTELKRGKQQMVKIVPTKGESWVVNLDHILTVILTNGCSPSHKKSSGYEYGSTVDICVKDYLKLPNATRHAMKLLSVATNWESKKLPFTPYFVGALLGDGGLSSRSTVTFTSENPEFWDAISYECDIHGWKLGDTNEYITQRITNAPNLFSWLRDNNLFPCACENKHIPHNYKTGDSEQRLQILAGLIDTDGYLHHSNGYEITLKSRRLSEDIVFISRSLGLAAYTSPCKKKCSNGIVGDYFRTNISGNVDIIPCRLKYKRAAARKQKKDVMRRGFRVELLNEDNYYGFSLDGDGRFLLGDFTVTHNTGKTYTACAVARELGYNIVVVCPKAVIKSWNKVITKHFKMGDKLIGIVNYEKLRTGRKDSSIASFKLNRSTGRKSFDWKLPKKTIIIWDESQKLKNWKTKNVKTCLAAIKEGYPMLFCSATNATNPLEMRCVGLALKIFKNGNAYYDWVKQNGVYKGDWGFEFCNYPKFLRNLHTVIFDHRGVRLRRDDIPNFPACEIIAEAYNMEEEDVKKINAIYDEMDRELAIANRRETADAARAKKEDKEQSQLVIQLRARQKIELIKVPLFVEMIEDALEQGFSVAVFINFTETLTALSERLKTKCIFDGQTPDKVRDRNVELFQEDKERIILINIQSGGAGLSLHDLNGNFPRMSIISPTYSPVFMRQALGRIWRDDAKTKCVQRIVCVADTIEEEVCRNVQQKLDNLDLLNDGDLAYGNKNYEIISD